MELIIPHQPCHIPTTADKIGGGHLTKLGPSDILSQEYGMGILGQMT